MYVRLRPLAGGSQARRGAATSQLYKEKEKSNCINCIHHLFIHRWTLNKKWHEHDINTTDNKAMYTSYKIEVFQTIHVNSYVAKVVSVLSKTYHWITVNIVIEYLRTEKQLANFIHHHLYTESHTKQPIMCHCRICQHFENMARGRLL